MDFGCLVTPVAAALTLTINYYDCCLSCDLIVRTVEKYHNTVFKVMAIEARLPAFKAKFSFLII